MTKLANVTSLRVKSGENADRRKHAMVYGRALTVSTVALKPGCATKSPTVQAVFNHAVYFCHKFLGCSATKSQSCQFCVHYPVQFCTWCIEKCSIKLSIVDSIDIHDNAF